MTREESNVDKSPATHPAPPSSVIRGRRVLLIDDHRNIRITLRMALESEGAQIFEAETARSGIEKLGVLPQRAAGESPPADGHPESFPWHVILLDIRLPDGSGLDILARLSAAGLASRVIMISGEGTVSDAFKATQMGAFDFVEKPFSPERIIVSVARCLEFNKLAAEREDLQRKVLRGQELIGDHPKIKEVMQLVRRVGPTSGRVLIVGESGTGKELVARAIHRASTRSEKPIIKVNCAAIPAGLIESELFGHEKGAFTGAQRQRLGVFERASGGTLFLDEIGELSLDLQSKLLRVLQNGEINRVGGEKTIQVDVRLIAATNRNLPEMIQGGEFREDLYYRLNVVTITTPPLRERASDIPLLAMNFLREACEEHSLGVKTFGATALAQFSAWRWPGNIRELRNMIERTAILSEDPVIEHIEELATSLSNDPQPQHGTPHAASGAPSASRAGGAQLSTTSPTSTTGADAPAFAFACNILTWEDFHDQAGREFVKFVLRHAKGNVSEAARLMCLERAYLHRLMKKLGIQRDIIVAD